MVTLAQVLKGDEWMDEILTFKEAAEFLKIGEKTLLKLLQEQALPARKLGREWRFSKQALVDWLSSGVSMDYSQKPEDIED
ncbi:helix-turn-helix domain-containing protein [Alicyclobacillus tolerans]|uniref:helix-turn-helix domain-containing protein n=1 Tax=Alicyclobacillus tolerans TaxID=90970 RepID=UPI001F2046D5|nr:helix-turn-helix domain-containing protein [Alicyclobacillus tolerans]MCF8567717.1 helix-turn-helix domain-containing protein [Alicyclobacillus tolerans]